jgi:hypothetical protein
MAPRHSKHCTERWTAKKTAAPREAYESLDFRSGIAGLTVAYWLRHYGFTPTIVERAASLVTGGYKIDVRGSGLQVLTRMGIHDSVVVFAPWALR